jgi:hypothetical protein
MTLPRLAQLEKAATLVASAMRPTPEICWPTLKRELAEKMDVIT